MNSNMNWRNALIGAVLGLLILKLPLGALIGALVGWFFGPRWPERSNTTSAHMLNPLFALAGAISKADGRVSEAEVKTTEYWMEQLALSKTQRKLAIAAFALGKTPQFDLETHARTLARQCGDRTDLKIMLLSALHQIGAADGRLHPEAARLQARIVVLMEIPIHLWQRVNARFDNRRQSPTQNAEPPAAQWDDYVALGVLPQSSDADIRHAYRKLLAKHHPDKLSGRHVSASEKTRAEEKTRQIIAAYERIKKARGTH